MKSRGNISEIERFWLSVKIEPEGCWEWQAGRYRAGYGQFWADGKVYAHRFSWQQAYGLIPEGLLVLHQCDNPPCVRPSHLFLGTVRDNSLDMIAKGRHRGPTKLNLITAQQIRTIYFEQHISQYRLADMYKVSQGLITQIINRRGRYRGLQ